MKIYLSAIAFVILLLAACSAPATPDQTIAAPSTPTAAPATAIPVLVTAQRTPTIPLPQTVNLSELGTTLALPSEWNIIKQPGVVLIGPGLDANNTMERTWLHVNTNADAPLTLPELTQAMTAGLRDVGHIRDLQTTRVKVGEFDAVAIWWTQPVPRDPNVPERWLSVYVPALGLVHEIVFHPILLAPDGKQLKAVGQAILERVKFSLPARANGVPLGLTIEEHALKSAPQIEPLIFMPVEGTQSQVLKRREDKRAEPATENLAAGQTQVVVRGDQYVANLVQASGGQKVSVQVTRNSKPVYTLPLGDASPITDFRGLWGYDTHWVLEVTHTESKKNPPSPTDMNYGVRGEVIRDGVSLSQQNGYEEAFGVQLLQGRLFYFFKRQAAPGVSHYGISFDNQNLDLGYTEIPHYGCCSAAALNPQRAKSMVAFFAQRSGTWYYVEIGAFE